MKFLKIKSLDKSTSSVGMSIMTQCYMSITSQYSWKKKKLVISELDKSVIEILEWGLLRKRMYSGPLTSLESCLEEEQGEEELSVCGHRWAELGLASGPLLKSCRHHLLVGCKGTSPFCAARSWAGTSWDMCKVDALWGCGSTVGRYVRDAQGASVSADLLPPSFSPLPTPVPPSQCCHLPTCLQFHQLPCSLFLSLFFPLNKSQDLLCF